MAKRIPVLVIEDNRLVRDGITAMLAEQPDLKVVAAVDGALGAVERVARRDPILPTQTNRFFFPSSDP